MRRNGFYIVLKCQCYWYRTRHLKEMRILGNILEEPLDILWFTNGCQFVRKTDLGTTRQDYSGQICKHHYKIIYVIDYFFCYWSQVVMHDILHKFNQCWTDVSNHRNSLNIPEVWRGQEDSRERTKVQQARWGYGPGSRMDGQPDDLGKFREEKGT